MVIRDEWGIRQPSLLDTNGVQMLRTRIEE